VTYDGALAFVYGAPLYCSVESLMELAANISVPTVPWQAWAGFAALVVVLLTLDLVVFHRKIHPPTLRESAGWVVFWCSLAVLFNLLVWYWRGSRPAIEFFTGYLIEWSLSMDNVFVFAVIFRFFRVELKYQYRVLFWGILGAIVMRLTFILVGVELVRKFEWMMPVFGAFLVYTAIKLALQHESEVDPSKNWLLNFARKHLRATHEFHNEHFFVRQEGRLFITPLFLVLLVIESTDVLFAVDSVPAVIGITQDPFIVFTSNVFAILGLRALYFLLASVLDLFRYLVYGLSTVLGFVGLKMIAEYFVPHQEGHHLIHPGVSLVVVAALIGTSIIASLVAKYREDGRKSVEVDA
jgi:tellurite resistance protein TerC